MENEEIANGGKSLLKSFTIKKEYITTALIIKNIWGSCNYVNTLNYYTYDMRKLKTSLYHHKRKMHMYMVKI